ncbi:PRC-barrel domain-containing protein [Gulosibacter sp. ACHW.36C]|uniref:PRC-barrel domain-containing protein n=1 Tax=Gulosibacter sediminis TaxID=1729695 RepID=A0ABY4MYX5_9MICO|nr:PRC-barrel domain-containing protein [Gulosibacter sediminis]UQN15645.1 PRC-barrel domain-containing protein [Gulosibacter sediminis]
MADSNDFQDDAVDPTSDDAASVPADAVSPSDDSVDASIETPEGGDDEISVAPSEVENAAPSEEELAAREAEAALLLIFQSTVFDKNGAKIGRVGQVYLDDQTQEPNWVTVKTGMFGTKEFFIPLDEAEQTEKRITVPYEKAKVHGAPFTEIDQNLSPEEEDELYNYYEVPGRTTTEGTLNVADPNDDAPKQKAEPETIAPLGGGVSREDTPLKASELLGDDTEAATDDAPTTSAFDDIVADAPSSPGAEDSAPDADTSDASPFDALAADAEAETPQRGDSDALSFDAFTDDGQDAVDGDASPFERPDREN